MMRMLLLLDVAASSLPSHQDELLHIHPEIERSTYIQSENERKHEDERQTEEYAEYFSHLKFAPNERFN